MVLDLSQIGAYSNQPADVYLWSNVHNLEADEPGGVIAVLTGNQLGPIAMWPEVSRHVIPLGHEEAMQGRWWAGFWGQWPGMTNAWFILADTNSSTSPGCAMTYVAPDINYPSGWRSVEVAWGATNALGIGVQGEAITSGVSENGVRLSTFGRVKSLFQ